MWPNLTEGNYGSWKQRYHHIVTFFLTTRYIHYRMINGDYFSVYINTLMLSSRGLTLKMAFQLSQLAPNDVVMLCFLALIASSALPWQLFMVDLFWYVSIKWNPNLPRLKLLYVNILMLCFKRTHLSLSLNSADQTVGISTEKRETEKSIFSVYWLCI